jgi:hypothetical protein
LVRLVLAPTKLTLCFFSFWQRQLDKWWGSSRDEAA